MTIAVDPMIVVIVALDAGGGFAKDGTIPWHIPADLKFFKDQTMGHPCIMGRKTYEDINRRMGDRGKDQVLPGRTSYVVSSTLTGLPNAVVVKDINDAINTHNDNSKPFYVIGGKRLFDEAISRCSQAVITIINQDYNTDTFFPTQYLHKHFVARDVQSNPAEPTIRFVRFVRK